MLLIFRWAAASNDISLNGMILPAALYFWQIPHFMALAYLCRDDYAAGGYVLIQLFWCPLIQYLSGGYSYCLYSQYLPTVLVHVNKELNGFDMKSDSG